ncbi:hypothetical protein [Synechococcus sp. NOUM97013]|uniref:hypothetical protein n=1 Tax=Synechococcus sp. NOUM97013 TaxID=1442555 RepID=UPI0018616E97|nr:putative conserved secreted protein [Synechococcus sp. NOUM97013]
MLLTAQRLPFTNVITGLSVAAFVVSAGALTPRKAEARPQQRQSLMALLEPQPMEAEQEPTSKLLLRRTDRRIPRTGDPIWELMLEIPGEPQRRFDAVSGRANRQNADRDRMGSRAPLPTGSYSVGVVEPLAAGAYPELGPVWISIEPNFITGRRVLGIHQDPSAGINNTQSGTLGCIGLVRRADMLELARLIDSNGTTQLDVID